MWPKGSGILEMKVEDIRNTDVGGDCEHDPVEPADGQDESFRNYAHCLIFRISRKAKMMKIGDLLSCTKSRPAEQLKDTA